MADFIAQNRDHIKTEHRILQTAEANAIEVRHATDSALLFSVDARKGKSSLIVLPIFHLYKNNNPIPKVFRNQVNFTVSATEIPFFDP